MADSTGRKQRKRIEYLESLALKQAAAAAGMIQEAQAARAASKTQGEPKI